MTDDTPNMLFWNRVLSICDTLEEDGHSSALIQSFLRGVDEGFSDVFDPSEHFSEYVTLYLCRSMAKFLDGLDHPAEND